MPKLQKETELFESVAKGDVTQSRKIAQSICEDQQHRGNHTAARRLRAALQRGESLSHKAPQNGNSLLLQPFATNGALSQLSANEDLSTVVLPKSTRLDLQLIISEWNNRELLLKNRLNRRTRLLFYGPPGCGKSMTARALAKEMNLPVYVVRFDAVVGAYLGQTAVHLRQLFQFVELTPCVLLLDEVDALGKKRGNPLEVGELDRIVISLMQELEHARPQGLVIATSNLPENLDRALWRRFDSAIEFPRPKTPELVRYSKSLAEKQGLPLPPHLNRRMVHATSFADAASAITGYAREQILLNKAPSSKK